MRRCRDDALRRGCWFRRLDAVVVSSRSLFPSRKQTRQIEGDALFARRLGRVAHGDRFKEKHAPRKKSERNKVKAGESET